ncbi:hypothetical protein Pmar_PMAR006059 [Perkinsus marinus ATCC 50983]|uniref:Uncharacterized protein n=1 Tax=Perkinsus marinus (strain ATCC 50983 / TXsc) TaxID=423536 RepID=C5LA38_PERM5|nr:hypothetical protein Pmar_PMAR006059 [Perkinsus marinus ATCC 50983]EER06294.1 hypothetical protein Pmar_PMAR006059 [Perkinsus marinus ATCC 50983]|eukprot:XP_002774478.1 hypothetical protein Pmar_PMAR006059 [Perkinsus marinus ATCC 50983]
MPGGSNTPSSQRSRAFSIALSGDDPPARFATPRNSSIAGGSVEGTQESQEPLDFGTQENDGGDLISTQGGTEAVPRQSGVGPATANRHRQQSVAPGGLPALPEGANNKCLAELKVLDPTGLGSFERVVSILGKLEDKRLCKQEIIHIEKGLSILSGLYMTNCEALALERQRLIECMQETAALKAQLEAISSALPSVPEAPARPPPNPPGRNRRANPTGGLGLAGTEPRHQAPVQLAAISVPTSGQASNNGPRGNQRELNGGSAADGSPAWTEVRSRRRNRSGSVRANPNLQTGGAGTPGPGGEAGQHRAGCPQPPRKKGVKEELATDFRRLLATEEGMKWRIRGIWPVTFGLALECNDNATFKSILDMGKKAELRFTGVPCPINEDTFRKELSLRNGFRGDYEVVRRRGDMC